MPITPLTSLESMANRLSPGHPGFRIWHPNQYSRLRPLHRWCSKSSLPKPKFQETAHQNRSLLEVVPGWMIVLFPSTSLNFNIYNNTLAICERKSHLPNHHVWYLYIYMCVCVCVLIFGGVPSTTPRVRYTQHSTSCCTFQHWQNITLKLLSFRIGQGNTFEWMEHIKIQKISFRFSAFTNHLNDYVMFELPF